MPEEDRTGNSPVSQPSMGTRRSHWSERTSGQDHARTRRTTRTRRTIRARRRARFPEICRSRVPAAKGTTLPQRLPSTAAASGRVRRCRSASSVACSASPGAGRAAAWPKPGRAPRRPEHGTVELKGGTRHDIAAVPPFSGCSGRCAGSANLRALAWSAASGFAGGEQCGHVGVPRDHEQSGMVAADAGRLVGAGGERFPADSRRNCRRRMTMTFAPAVNDARCAACRSPAP
jgi:hypothetical protein